MNVGLVIYGKLDTVSGGFFYDRKLVEHLESQGDRVEVFSLPWRDYGRHLLDNVSNGFVETLSSARLDALIQDELNHPSLFALNGRLKRRVSYPIVSLVHHLRCSELRPSWQNRFYRVVERRYLSTVDGFVFVSHTTRSDVEALVGRGKPWVVAHPAREENRLALTEADVRARALQPGPVRILFVGNLIPRKNLHTLVEALARLPLSSWRLDVIGSLETDPNYVRSIKGQLSRHRIGGNIDMKGTVTGVELNRRYARSHVVAVPSSYEGFGMVYLEGMGFGLPALAANKGAAHEIVTHGRTGFLVEPSDPRATAEIISMLHQDRAKLCEMGVAALERHRSHPTWTETGSTIRNFIKGMVHGS